MQYIYLELGDELILVVSIFHRIRLIEFGANIRNNKIVF